MSLNDLITSEALRKRVEEAGYTSLDELKNKSIIQLTQDIELSEEEVSTLVSLIHGKDVATTGTLAINLAQEQQNGITTSCQRLDQLLESTTGIPKCGITELSGGPGSGKTQFCIQLALNVQLPIAEGGLDGTCIYIDTVGGLMIERFYQMAQANKDLDEAQIQSKLQRITHFRIVELGEMVALVRQLPLILQEQPKVKLLIVDSIAYHLRLNIRDNRTRVGLVNFIGQSLVQLANQFDLAIVVTNCISMDRMFNHWRPSLGDSWGQWCTHRLMLTRRRQQRYATVYNAPQETSRTMAPFCITETGIKDIDMETLEKLYQWQEETEPELNQEDPSLVPPTLWQSKYDNEDIWGEQGGLTDELLSEIPSYISYDESMTEEEERRIILVQDSQSDHSYIDHLLQQEDQEEEDQTIHTSVEPPASDYHRHLRRHSSPPHHESGNKRSRYRKDDDTDKVDHANDSLSGDDWGSDNDELWLSIADMSSPSL